MTDDNELQHHGVKGMKWGVRKRRDTGDHVKRSRFGDERKQKAPTVVSRGNTFRESPNNRRMSDAELRSRLNRLQMEKQYSELTASPKGKSFVKELLADTGKQVARQAFKNAGNVALQLALEGAAKNSKGGTKVFLSAMAATGAKKKKD